jgi:membrane fusion protein
MRQLFRQEALDAQRDKQLGEVLRIRSVPLWLFTGLIILVAVSVLAYALWGQLARRERVDGYLALDVGAARILAPAAGSLAELLVHEGDTVAPGQPLARLALDTPGVNGNTADLVDAQIASRMAALTREQQQTELLARQQADQVRRKIQDLTAEVAQIDAEIRLQQQRVASAEQLAQRYADLTQEKFVSDIVVQQRRDEVIDQRVKLEALKRQKGASERELSATRAEEPTIATRSRSQTEQLQRQASELAQSRIQEAARRENIIRAPFAGVISNLAVAQGQSVAADQLLATVLPQGSRLHAELLVPTRAIGFIKTGSTVQLRYEAFAFQRFGQYRGVVTRVGRTVWSAGERVGPLTSKEPVYRVDVDLERQDVQAAGQSFGLKSGMLVSADILLERRSIFEWMFEPVLQLRGWQQ